MSDAEPNKTTGQPLKIAIARGPECPNCHLDTFDDWHLERGLKMVGMSEDRLTPTTAGADVCPADGKPCYASAGTDDARWRCGTRQCQGTMIPVSEALRVDEEAAP